MDSGYVEDAGSNIVNGKFQQHPRSKNTTAETVQIPLYGRIAAGTAIEALSDPTSTIDIPQFMLGAGDHYALEVEGDSMIEAGIHDGDTVLITRCDNAENGSIVVAFVDDMEVTLKRLRRKGNSIALEPANAAYKTRICGPDQVKVQGRLVGLFRRY
jgi:repressor LexA